MDENSIVASVASEVENRLRDGESSHDWWHTYRVWKMAHHIGTQEGADLLVVDLASLLHDIADWKFFNGDCSVGPRLASEILSEREVPKEIVEHVKQIISECSFRGLDIKTTPSTLEGRIVQDADRLDAVGAIGIARTFTYGGHRGRAMYDPNVRPVHSKSNPYSIVGDHSINHFYEKLLHLKNLMNTDAARFIAERRHKFMEEYLDHFYREWEGVA